MASASPTDPAAASAASAAAAAAPAAAAAWPALQPPPPPLPPIAGGGPAESRPRAPPPLPPQALPQLQAAPAPPSPSSPVVVPKNVAFELLFTEQRQYRARLPMRVQIYPHDTTDSIVTTVKNFYGLYAGPSGSKGVSFEDEQGNILIARYENFRTGMTVYVRVIEEVGPYYSPGPAHGYGHGAAYYGDYPGRQFGHHHHPHPPPPPFPPPSHPHHDQCPSHHTGHGQSHHPAAHHAHHHHAANHGGHGDGQTGQGLATLGPDLRTTRRRSPSPSGAAAARGRGRRSPSGGRRHSSGRSRSSRQQHDCGDSAANGYSSSSSDNASSSGRKDQIGNTEISVENIVEGGRRKRAKFDSSALPLFAPPQMPASISNPSVSPVRRVDHYNRQSLPTLPFAPSGQNHFGQIAYPPQSSPIAGQMYSIAATPDAARRPRAMSYGAVLPTPDPTVGTCVSEEDKDVAMQLMRLGEMSNFSSHGRNSASTLDDAFSGRADAASSPGATADDDDSEEAGDGGEGDGDDGGDAGDLGADGGSGRDSEDEEDGHLLVSSPPPIHHRELPDVGPGRKKYPTEVLHQLATAPPPPIDLGGSGGSGGADAAGAGTKKSVKPKPGAKPRSAKPKTAKPLAPAKGSKPTGVVKSKSKKMTSVVAAAAAAAAAASAAAHVVNGPMSPPSMPPSRKQSVTSVGPAPLAGLGGGGEQDHRDLSTKPRCQRCRKSKKGCDRQRPCQRCRDAGISDHGCVSEDETNGRKGRYGRHMGIPIKKEELQMPPAAASSAIFVPTGPILDNAAAGPGPGPALDHAALTTDKPSKKRKR